MTILIVVLYLYVLFNHIRVVVRKDVLYAGKDEDHYQEEEKKKGKTEKRHEADVPEKRA